MLLPQRLRDYIPLRQDAASTSAEEELGSYSGKEQAHYTTSEVRSDEDRSTPLRPQAITHLLRHAAYELIPTFLRRTPHTDEHISQTAFLDGARGVAAFFVFHQHLLQGWTHHIMFAYGHPGDTSIFQLPILRLVFSGGPMVMLFFAISGYSLSYGPLCARRDRGAERMLLGVSSSVFRRAIRLYLPPMIVSFIFANLVYFGACEHNRAYHATFPDAGRFPHLLPSYGEQIGAWVKMVRTMTLTFTWESDWPIFDPHLWTIRTEFMSSLVLYLVMMCTARVKPLLRLGIILVAIVYVVYWARWELFCFIGGLFVAETDVLRNVYRLESPASTLPATTTSLSDPPQSRTGLFASTRTFLARKGAIFWTANLLCSLYLLSMPIEGADTTPLYSWLWYMIPPAWRDPHRDTIKQAAFWWAIAAFQLIWTCSNFPPLRVLFTNRFSRYLGKVSYALYIVHGPLIWTVGESAARTMQGFIGIETPLTKWSVVAFEYAVLLPCLFFLSDVVWRLVDVRSVSFAKWVQGKCFA